MGMATGVANAQSVSTTAGSASGQITPGQVERRFEAPVLPKAGGDPILPEFTEDEQQQGGENIKFTLKTVNIQGGSVFDDVELAPLYEEFVGQKIALSKVFDIAAKITAKYRNAGYILSRAIVPPQKIAGGNIKISIVEGFIDQVRIEGDIQGDQGLLSKYAKNVTNSKPLDAKELERFVLLLNDLAGVAARVVLLPSQTVTGASDVVVVVTHDPYQFVATVDNRGSRFLGPIQMSVAATANSIFGGYESTTLRSVRTTQTKEFELYELTHARPIGTDGTILNLGFTRSFVNPGFDIGVLDVASDSSLTTVGVTHPYIRSREENLFVNAEFSTRDSETSILGTPSTEDRVRSIKLGASYDFLDSSNAVNLISPSITQGLNILNERRSGVPSLSRSTGRSDFTRVNLDYLRLQSLTDTINLYFSVSGQYAFSPLLSSEEFGYGGAQFGRAYDPSEITGDHGLAGVVELRRPYYLEEDNYIDSLEVYGFFDIGRVWNIDSELTGTFNTSGASAGVGTRFDLFDVASGTMELALPLTRDVAARSGNDPQKGDDVRFFFSLVTNF